MKAFFLTIALCVSWIPVALGAKPKPLCKPFAKVAEGKIKKFLGRDSDFKVPAYATPKWRAANQKKIAKLFILDTETTGVEPAKDSVIEFGGRLIEVNRETGELLSVGESYDAYQDPGHPLDPEITSLTGIKDSDLKGQSIDWKIVQRLAKEADLVISHNAEFDRAFLEKTVPAARKAIWGCSFRQMAWAGKGHDDAKLEHLSRDHGFYVDAHRALEDVNALVYLMTRPNPETKAAYFAELVQSTEKPVIQFDADGAAYAKKDALKERGYTWNGKNWWRYVPKDEGDAEKEWLASEVYDGEFKGRTTPVKPADRFRARTVD